METNKVNDYLMKKNDSKRSNEENLFRLSAD